MCVCVYACVRACACFSEIVELRHIVGKELISKLIRSAEDESDQSALRECFTALMTFPTDVVRHQLEALVNRLQCNCW